MMSCSFAEEDSLCVGITFSCGLLQSFRHCPSIANHPRPIVCGAMFAYFFGFF